MSNFGPITFKIHQIFKKIKFWNGGTIFLAAEESTLALGEKKILKIQNKITRAQDRKKKSNGSIALMSELDIKQISLMSELDIKQYQMSWLIYILCMYNLFHELFFVIFHSCNSRLMKANLSRKRSPRAKSECANGRSFYILLVD